MKAIIVCVDYSDYLAITLPRNKGHFEEVMVVTTPTDLDTLQVIYDNECQSFITNSFYDKGAIFNKWVALEEGLDYLGRNGWLCIMDADIILPSSLSSFPTLDYKEGNLYTPIRYHFPKPLPETEWSDLPYNAKEEFAGYTQIFHASDQVLGNPPWHDIKWKHAGGADSFFAMKWPMSRRIRPPFRVLHLGESGLNWCGRVTPYLDGRTPEQAAERKKLLATFLQQRKSHRFKHEKL